MLYFRESLGSTCHAPCTMMCSEHVVRKRWPLWSTVMWEMLVTTST